MVLHTFKEGFLAFIDPDSIRAGLAGETMISHRYRSVRNGEERYEMLRMAGVRLIEERDDNMVHAIAAGFSDVDRETREQLNKNRELAEALARAEEAKVSLRNIRRDANDAAKKAQKGGDLTEDELKKMLDDIQKMTDSYIATVDKDLAVKEKELMTV